MSKRTHGERFTLGTATGATWCGRDVDTPGLLFADSPTCKHCAPQKSAAKEQRPPPVLQQDFLAKCMGVRLRQRGLRDPHITFSLLVEDDGRWYEKDAISSHWLEELIGVLRVALTVCRSQEPDVVRGQQYGWRWRP